ncbi:MAG: flagellar hook-basal body protein [Planctomycetota bacterium]
MSVYGIYLNAAGSLASETRIDVLANNLANVDTPGFKRGFAVFQERPTEAYEPPRYDPAPKRVLDELGGGLFVHEVTFDDTIGMVQQTGNTLDLALQGDGWFTVQVGDEQLYTRAGNFAMSPDRFLITADGRGQVLDTSGNPIQLPDQEVTVAGDGQISAGGDPIARLWVQGSVDHEHYEPVGDNVFRFFGEGTPQPSDARVLQGSLERSTVQPVQEMVAMIRTFRAYESNQRMITQQDQALGRAVNDVGRVGGSS